MFTGFNREVRNSLRLAGLRISYAVAAVQIAAEQYGAAVAANIDLVLSPRGTSSSLSLSPNRSQSGIVKFFAGGRGELQITSTSTDAGDPIIAAGPGSINLRVQSNSGTLFLNGNSKPIMGGDTVSGTHGFLLSTNPTRWELLSYNSAGVTFILGGRDIDSTLDIPGDSIIQTRDRPSAATNNLSAGRLVIRGGNGASGSAGAANGADVTLDGGSGFGTGKAGNIVLAGTTGGVRLGPALGYNAVVPTIASAATIAPTKPATFISGTNAIVTITPPAHISATGGEITLIPTGLWTTTTAGNIALATTAVVNKALTLTYDATTAKWYPSY